IPLGSGLGVDAAQPPRRRITSTIRQKHSLRMCSPPYDFESRTLDSRKHQDPGSSDPSGALRLVAGGALPLPQRPTSISASWLSSDVGPVESWPTAHDAIRHAIIVACGDGALRRWLGLLRAGRFW